MKGLPMTYNRDMQEDKEPLFDAADQFRVRSQMARVVMESVKLHPDPPRAAAEESWVVATDLGGGAGAGGTPFHQAHQIVGRLVLESVQAGKRPGDWTAESLANSRRNSLRRWRTAFSCRRYENTRPVGRDSSVRRGWRPGCRRSAI